MHKFWYFSAIIILTNSKKDVGIFYSGYVKSKDFFPIDIAELQSRDYAPIPNNYDREHNIKQVIILNQVEVHGRRYEVWKDKMGFM